MYLFYVDECGRPSLEDKSLAIDPWFVMAAVGIHSTYWLLIDTEITRLKQKYFPFVKPLKVEFKSTNIRSAGGPHPRWPFSELKPEALRALVDELYAIYDQFSLPLFTVTINRAEHKDKYTKKRATPGSPLSIGF